jgi:hypothetical protein
MKLMKQFTTPEHRSIIAVGSGPNRNERPRIMGTVLLGCRPGSKPAATPIAVPRRKQRSRSIIIISKVLCRKNVLYQYGG